ALLHSSTLTSCFRRVMILSILPQDTPRDTCVLMVIREQLAMSIDDTALPELTRRQEEILSLIVRAYTNLPEPISSKHLVETYSLSFSSATIRNEMAVLEEKGYIYAPHPSAGRVPTESGYRYFV